MRPGGTGEAAAARLSSHPMSAWRTFLRALNPLAAARDLRTQLAEPRPHRWPLMGVAAAATFAVFSVMFQEGAQGLPRPPNITYIESWELGRSDAEIIAGNVAATEARKAREAQAAASAERVRQMYKALGRASGMDVDAIERKARSDAAAEARARAAAEATVPEPRIAPLAD
jgi:hypothetical protein